MISTSNVMSSVGTIPLREQAKHLASELGTALIQAKLNPSCLRGERGYFRNTPHVFFNLQKALEKYAETGNLKDKISATCAVGQSSTPQPYTVSLTFQRALDPLNYGGVQQSLAKISLRPQIPEDTNVAEIVREISKFLQRLSASVDI